MRKVWSVISQKDLGAAAKILISGLSTGVRHTKGGPDNEGVLVMVTDTTKKVVINPARYKMSSVYHDLSLAERH